MRTPTSDSTSIWRRRCFLMALVCSLLFATWFVVHRKAASLANTAELSHMSLTNMRANADRILQLQEIPQTIAERRKPNDALLAQIDQALQKLRIPDSLWQDSIPLSPRRSTDSDYVQHATRLYFEQITLQQLVSFAHTIIQEDPTLQVVDLRISSRFNHSQDQWDVEITLGYQVYSPQQKTVSQ